MKNKLSYGYRHSIGLLFFLFSTAVVVGQDKGIVKFLVDVDNGYFEIELNDSLLLKRYKDTLPVGKYNAKVWSPGYVVTNVSFSIEKDKTTELYVQMAKNNDFIDYENNYQVYRNQFHKNYTVPISASLLSAITTGAFMVRSYSLKKKLSEDIDQYYKSPITAEIEEIKARITANNRKYNVNRTGFYVNGGITLALIGGTVWSIRKFNKNYTEPVYNKESPFKDKYSFQINPFGCSFVLHI